MRKILIIEDNEVLLLGLKNTLQNEKFIVYTASSIHTAKNTVIEDIDLILLDINLPDGSGFEFCKYIKSVSEVPIIMLTVCDSERDIIHGLNIGADDYVTKPFKLNILISRINTVLRRTEKQKGLINKIQCQNITIIKSSSKVYKDDIEIFLTKNEYHLLLLLLENKNQIVTRDILLQKLWDVDENFVSDNTLTTLMKRVRQKIEVNAQLPQVIKTVRGFGYIAEDRDGE